MLRRVLLELIAIVLMMEENSPCLMSSADSSDEVLPGSLPPTCDLAEDPLVTRLVRVLDEYLDDLKAGKAVSRAELLAAHPDLAERLESCLAGIDFLNPAAGDASDGEPAGARQLGDFQIVREVGRGGMGAVYEARQISLDRRVALKVLRFGSVSDPEAIGRFQREAETVANLHHTNIVPIFSVGSEQGVNHYAMQFIDGDSLDKVLRRDDRPLDQQRVARWGLQAAEALAHAHQRDVIHRDVKPSNLILDEPEGRIWLTDFGLAKRLDDVTLSMTGALLGTPRYMSPEQADATRRTVDHRTDLYSLGATLYELLTREPVFEAATPHAVLHQILAEPPRSLRSHRPSIERDLETIVMKCLAKDPAERYPSAQALADDLRAFLDGRPIRARRPSILDVVIKSLKRRRHSVALSVGSFVAAIVFFAASLVSYFGYQQSQQARLNLQTPTPPLIAELMKLSGEELDGPQTLPTQQPIDIPSGELAVRVSGAGQLSQTFRTSLPPGQNREFELDLTDSQIGLPIRFDRTLRMVRMRVDEARPASDDAPSSLPQSLRVRLNAVLLDDDGITLKPLVDSEPTMSLRITKPIGSSSEDRAAWVGDAIGFRWWTDFSPVSTLSGYDKFDLRPFIVGQIDDPSATAQVAPDLDGDSVADLVIAAQHQAWILALSGKDLSTLWFAPRGSDLFTSFGRPEVLSATISPPISAGDLNDDGAVDLIAVFADANDDTESRRWIEAVSGRDGSTLWKTDLPAPWFTLPNGRETPYAFRWFVRGSQGSTAGGGGGWSNYNGIVTRSRQMEHTRHGQFVAVPDRPRLAGSRVFCLAGRKLLSIDIHSGEVDEHDLTQVIAARPVTWADVDGDGHEDALLVEYLGTQQTPSGYPPVPARVPRARVAAWSLEKAKLLWQRDITIREPQRAHWSVDPPDWPIVADLDGDGASEVIVPNGTTEETKRMADIPWGAIEVLEGRSGKQIWSRRIPNMDQWCEYLATGGDIDGDGTHDIFAASLWSDQYDLYVDCYSGADGHLLWQSRRTLRTDLSDGTEYVLTGIQRWSQGNGGLPVLMVTTDHRHGMDAAVTHVFSAATGELAHLIREPNEILVSDADADGIDDLAIIHGQPEHMGREGGGQVSVVRGLSGELWRRLAGDAIPAADYDGDAIRDVLVHDHGSLHLFSGKTGDALWQTALPHDFRDFFVAHDAGTTSTASIRETPFCGGQPSHADLNGDGSPDLVLCNHRGMGDSLGSLVAYSGASGKRLWTAELGIQNLGGVLAVEINDLDDDGSEEVVLLASMDLDYPQASYYTSAREQLWILVLSGNSGRLEWKQALSPAYSDGNLNSPYRFERGWVEPGYADLDRDGVLDLIVPADSSNAPGANLELRAFSGKDGKTLWAAPYPAPRRVDEAFKRLIPVETADLDGDGRVEVIQPCVTSAANSTMLQIRVLDGQSGKQRWQWQSAVDVDLDRLDLWPQDWFARPRVVVARRSDGTRAVAMLIQTPERSVELVAIAASGAELTKVSLGPAASAFRDYRQRVLTEDIDDDGNDEFILRRPDELFAMRLFESGRPVWSRTGLDSGDRVIGVRKGDGSSHAAMILMAGASGDNSLVGLDAATGEVRWRCAGPTPSQRGVPRQVEDVSLLSLPDQSPPLASFAYDNVILCRRGAPALLPHDPMIQAIDRDSVGSFAVPTVDPRWVRPLPWSSHNIDLAEISVTIAWMVFYCVTLLILPVGFVGYLVSRRSFGLRPLLLAPVVVSIAMMGVTLSGPGEQVRDLATKFSMAAMTFAPLVASGVVIHWGLVRRWRAVSFWIGLSVLIAAVMSVVVLFFVDTGVSGDLMPEQQWSYRGWYMIWFPAAVLTSWILLFALAMRGVGSRFRRRRVRPVAEPHSARPG